MNIKQLSLTFYEIFQELLLKPSHIIVFFRATPMPGI